jgi:universal stress protein A
MSTTQSANSPSQSSEIGFRTILVPTDFSAISEHSMEYVQRLAKRFHSAVVLLHVFEPSYPYPVDGLAHFPGDLHDPRNELQSRLSDRLELLTTEWRSVTGLPVTSEIRLGRAYDEIVTTARKIKADLIVIPTHGYTGLKHVLIGSTAEKVVRHAPCPVLVIRPNEEH